MVITSKFRHFIFTGCCIGLIAGCSTTTVRSHSGSKSSSTSTIAPITSVNTNTPPVNTGTIAPASTTATNLPPANLMAPCDPLPAFSGNNMNTQDLVGYNISVMQAYGKCSMKLQSLQNWLNANS